MLEVITPMLLSVNAATETFKKAIERFNLASETKSLAAFVFAMLAGIFVAFSANAGKIFFDATLLENQYVAGNILIGLSLGYGSKATYLLIDLIGALRNIAPRPASPVTIEAENVSVKPETKYNVN